MTSPLDLPRTVRIRLCRRPDGTYYWQISVRSIVRPNLLRNGIVEANNSNPQLVGILAGALAEELCERYADKLDPSSVARAAISLFKEMEARNPQARPGYELPTHANAGAIRVARDS